MNQLDRHSPTCSIPAKGCRFLTQVKGSIAEVDRPSLPRHALPHTPPVSITYFLDKAETVKQLLTGHFEDVVDTQRSLHPVDGDKIALILQVIVFGLTYRFLVLVFFCEPVGKELKGAEGGRRRSGRSIR